MDNEAGGTNGLRERKPPAGTFFSEPGAREPGCWSSCSCSVVLKNTTKYLGIGDELRSWEGLARIFRPGCFILGCQDAGDTDHRIRNEERESDNETKANS